MDSQNSIFCIGRGWGRRVEEGVGDGVCLNGFYRQLTGFQQAKSLSPFPNPLAPNIVSLVPLPHQNLLTPIAIYACKTWLKEGI